MPSDEQLRTWCKRLRASDPQAFEELFQAFYTPIFRYARGITNRAAPARDIAQDVFVKLWEIRYSLDPDRSVKALLYRMARNQAYNHQRDRATHREKQESVQEDAPASPSPLHGPDVEVASGQLESRLKRWIDELPERQREALQLSRYEGLSHDEIAEVMEISPNTVNNHLVRALETLRDRIRDYEPDLLDP